MPGDNTLLNDVDASTGILVGHSNQWIGVLCRPADPVLRQHLQLPEGVGLVVEQVVPNSPAATAGVRARDILTHLDGEPLTGLDQLMAKTAAAGEGGIRLSWVRDGKVERDAATVHPQVRPNGAAAFRIKPDATSMQDTDRLREWVDKLQGGQFTDEGGKPFRFRFFGPGVTLQPGQNVPLQLSLGNSTAITMNRRRSRSPRMVRLGRSPRTTSINCQMTFVEPYKTLWGVAEFKGS